METLERQPQTLEAPTINRTVALEILQGKTILTESLHAAYLLREKYFAKKVKIHILDNIRNGHCPEDCGYCAQRKKANSGIQKYSLKSEEEIMASARQAKENGAFRFCMVTSGTGPTDTSIEKVAPIIARINKELGMKVCLSAGLLDAAKAEKLKAAGLDRYNHNLNTSAEHYPEICSTHTFQDRVNTLEVLQENGIGACSGLIAGMGESEEDLVSVAFELNRLQVASIPVNYFIPISGHALKNVQSMSPEYCLRILIMLRLVNPNAEIRAAAGREGHLGPLQAMALFPANSVFASGYLNVKGSDIYETVRLIQNAGFVAETASGEPLEISQDESFYQEETIQEMYKYQPTLD